MPTESGVDTVVRTFERKNDATVSVIRELYRINMSTITSVQGVAGEWLVYVNDSGIEVFEVIEAVGATLSTSGFNLIVTQSSGVDVLTFWAATRII